MSENKQVRNIVRAAVSAREGSGTTLSVVRGSFSTEYKIEENVIDRFAGLFGVGLGLGAMCTIIITQKKLSCKMVLLHEGTYPYSQYISLHTTNALTLNSIRIAIVLCQRYVGRS